MCLGMEGWSPAVDCIAPLAGNTQLPLDCAGVAYLKGQMLLGLRSPKLHDAVQNFGLIPNRPIPLSPQGTKWGPFVLKTTLSVGSILLPIIDGPKSSPPYNLGSPANHECVCTPCSLSAPE